jgi:hypothetical protein
MESSNDNLTKRSLRLARSVYGVDLTSREPFSPQCEETDADPAEEVCVHRLNCTCKGVGDKLTQI